LESGKNEAVSFSEPFQNLAATCLEALPEERAYRRKSGAA